MTEDLQLVPAHCRKLGGRKGGGEGGEGGRGGRGGRKGEEGEIECQ